MGYHFDEGTKRLVEFNLLVLPIALHYKVTQIATQLSSERTKREAFARLHSRYAPRSLEIILRQRGFYVKAAQFCSQLQGVLPEEYVEAFSVLRDDAPSLPFYQIQPILERDLGTRISDIFSYVSTRPLAAASIGQVHAATLRNGTEVVVKVQYPLAEEQFYTDMEHFMRLSSIIAPYYVEILRALRNNFLTEFDYRREADLQRQAHVNLKRFPGVVVPLPFDRDHPSCREFGNLCTKNVLVMERLRGQSVDSWATQMLQLRAVQEGTTVDEVMAELRAMSMKDVQKLLPSKLALDTLIAYRGFCDALRNHAAFVYNWTLGWIGSPINYVHGTRPVNIYSVVDTIFRVQAYCIFNDGFFNGDPHAGNVMLLDDGRVGLIDWGQVTQFAPKEQALFAKMVVAVADRDEQVVAELAWEMGLETEHHTEWVAAKVGTFYCGSHGDEVTGELGGPILFEENIAKIDRVTRSPDVYITAMRNLILTRCAVSLLGFPFMDSAVCMRTAAQACLQRFGDSVSTVPCRKVPRPDVEALLGRVRS